MQLQVMTLRYDAARGQFDTAALNEWLWAKHLEPVSIELAGESLEAVFLRLTSESGPAEAAKPIDPADGSEHLA